MLNVYPPMVHTCVLVDCTSQLWDRDVFKFNDHIAEGQLDLGPFFLKAYKTRDTVKLFPMIDPKLEEMRKADVSTVRLYSNNVQVFSCVDTCASCRGSGGGGTGRI